MIVGHEKGKEPIADGLYAAEVYFGWKLLEFAFGEWWHPSKVGKWTAGAPVQWVGPLPDKITPELPPVKPKALDFGL